MTRHLVIDEMQDYTPVQYAVINRLFSCSKTILGDYGQFLNPCHAYGLADLKRIYAGEGEVNLISSESTDYIGGISVTSVRMAKGLEFDEVIVPQANDRTYCSAYDRVLLYIACTRAMYRLTLIHAGELLRFVETGVLEDR